MLIVAKLFFLAFGALMIGCGDQTKSFQPQNDSRELVVVNSIVNGDFEAGETLEEIGWEWWSLFDEGGISLSSEAYRGARSIKIEKGGKPIPGAGYHDWSFTNGKHLQVQEGQMWTASAWVKTEDTDRIALEIIELDADGERLHPRGTSSHGHGGTHETYGTGDWTRLQATSLVPPGVSRLQTRFAGVGSVIAWVDNVRMHRGGPERTRPPKPKVEGWAYDGERIYESLGRGVVATTREQGDIYVRWRLLKEDPNEVAFNVYRASNGGDPVKLNREPVEKTTDFVDETADPAVENRYFVRVIDNDRELEASGSYTVEAGAEVKPYLSIPLKDELTEFERVGIADLNGDGRYDFVIKTPRGNVDPYHGEGYWEPSRTTYKLQAYLSDGTFLWEKDLGWNIELGPWYSPFVVYDFNGNGRAEVALKTAPTDVDYRDPEPEELGRFKPGRVREGPEYLSILDGMTGEEKARTDWPSRDGVGNYMYYSRNQIGVAYLDGKTPAVLAARGTYGLLKLHAFQYHDDELDPLWTWESPNEPGGWYYGQGAHNMLTMDLDGDGRDEVILGSAVIDDNGDGLWSTGLGHPDVLYAGNLNPDRPGYEIAYGLETDQSRYGINMVDARTGAILWGLDQPTEHIHSAGLVSNIDTTHAGMEVYAGESGTGERWLYSARGEVLAREDEIPWRTLAPRAAYWDATTQREIIVGGRIFRYPDNHTVFDGVEGNQVAWVDLFGDWREEIITSVPGELRIYTTPIPARDRRVTLVQDHLYRTSVAHMAMGYGHRPALTSYIIE